MLLPVEISFCSIIFHHAFSSSLPQLIKLVTFSCVVHQLCFTLSSSLPFAVGQVQDAGLIFLSAMAMLFIVSKCKLASLVQYLPMPVIGGYLAYIGFYCGIAGLMMMAGVDKLTDVLQSADHFALMAPGIFSGVGMYWALRTIRSPFVLPGSFAIILMVFYGTMFSVGMSFEEARVQGWIAPFAPASSMLESWSLFDFGKVEWHILPQQTFRLIGMFFVVSFSSSLDISGN
jgi:SulP family sulfate permease